MGNFDVGPLRYFRMAMDQAGGLSKRDCEPSDNGRRKRQNGALVFVSEIADASAVKVAPPYDRASDNGWTLVKGTITSIVLALVYALLKRL